jgi:hypothetical protein
MSYEKNKPSPLSADKEERGKAVEELFTLTPTLSLVATKERG